MINGTKARIGIIGGSGLYEIDGFKAQKSIKVKTPFGDPSDEYVVGELGGREVVFLPRHGKGHRILPTELNYRANIYGMKSLGVEQIISISAVGSFKEELKPLDIVMVDQFVDRTNQARKTTFFGDGVVAHISFAEPVCSSLRNILYESAKSIGASVHPKGTYLNMEGPAFSTKAESLLYKGWGMDVIGMTNMAEARLAREAEICYSTAAMVTDYDCWHESAESVTIDMIIDNLKKNAEMAKKLIIKTIAKLPLERKCSCASTLQYAIITPADLIPKRTKQKLHIFINKYMKR
ncbi:MAG: S-methyl-5'-thioadenosine phosphorylase [Candidatus Omnitrophica bacterium]|nr:S-methyl-5'-thioadenosine phosphorylase [Candidatus Omnitrophota bacterium]